jgi:hypothetical protein
MDKYLFGFLLLFVLACQACQNNAHQESFLEIDTTDNNQIIRLPAVNNEKWVQEPLTIINKFYRPEYFDIALNTVYNVSLVKDSKDHYTVTVFQEGFKDSHMAGIKFIVDLQWNYPGFSIQKIRRAYKCNQGSGTPVYSKDSCR